MIRRLGSLLDRFWFSNVDPWQLGILRIVLIGGLALPRISKSLNWLEWAAETPIELMQPVLAIRLLHLPYPMPQEMIGWFGIIVRTAGFCALFGIFTRVSLILFSLGFLYLAGGQSSWGFFAHTPSLPAQALLILAFAPGSDAWSLDRVFKTLGSREEKESFWNRLRGPLVSAWGLRLILVLLALTYFSAGLSKIRYSGLKWADGKTLGFYMNGSSISQLQQFSGPIRPSSKQLWKDGFGIENYLYATPGTKLSRRLAQNAGFMAILSVFTLVTELGFPLVLLGGFFQTIFLLAAASFHAGSHHLMGVNFDPWLYVCLILVDWKTLIKKGKLVWDSINRY